MSRKAEGIVDILLQENLNFSNKCIERDTYT